MIKKVHKSALPLNRHRSVLSLYATPVIILTQLIRFYLRPRPVAVNSTNDYCRLGSKICGKSEIPTLVLTLISNRQEKSGNGDDMVHKVLKALFLPVVVE